MSEMNVLIINPPIRLSDKPRNIPHGLAILANIIRDNLGICPTFLDINAHRYTKKETKKIIENTDFDVVLIGGISSVYDITIRLSEFVKSVNPDAKIISGGYLSMSIPKVLLKNSDIDIICTGEGENTIVELLNRLGKKINAHLDDIAGIFYKKEMMEKARENYNCFIMQEEINTKTRKLFSTLLDKYPPDTKDLEHCIKHGGMSTF